MKKLILAIALMLGCTSCDELIATYEEPEMIRTELPDSIEIREPEPIIDTLWISPGTPISFNVTVQDYVEV